MRDDERGALHELQLRRLQATGVEVGRDVFRGGMADMVAFTGSVSDRLTSVLGLRPKVPLVELVTLERAAGKARRMLDRREIG